MTVWNSGTKTTFMFVLLHLRKRDAFIA